MHIFLLKLTTSQDIWWFAEGRDSIKMYPAGWPSAEKAFGLCWKNA